jgi:ribosome-binding factor A
MSQKNRRPGKGPSQRQLRVGELLRHALAEILEREEFRDPVLADATVTVTEVRASPDMRNATVFVMPLGGRDGTEIVAALRRAAPFLRRRLGARLRDRPVLRSRPADRRSAPSARGGPGGAGTRTGSGGRRPWRVSGAASR